MYVAVAEVFEVCAFLAFAEVHTYVHSKKLHCLKCHFLWFVKTMSFDEKNKNQISI